MDKLRSGVTDEDVGRTPTAIGQETSVPWMQCFARPSHVLQAQHLFTQFSELVVSCVLAATLPSD